MDKLSVDQILKSYGIEVNGDILGIIIEITVLLLFVAATARALYQWLAPKFGVVSPGRLGRLLRINGFFPDNGFRREETGLWKTFLIISVLVLASRFLIYYLCYIVRVTQSVNQGYPSYGFFDSFMNIWNRWDSPHYIDIARDWYLTEAQVTQGDSYLFIVFFPLLPLLMRFSGIFAAEPSNAFYFASGCIISNIAMCVGCFYFFRLVQQEYDRKTAVWALLFLLFNPASLFFGICYTESLFLCLCVMFFWYLRKEHYIAAGILGGLAAFTRSLGVLLAIPFFVQWLDSQAYSEQKLRSKLLRLAPVFIITAGTLAYLGINYFIYGNPLQFMEYQKHWGQHFTFFASNIADIGVRIIYYEGINSVLVMWLPEFLVIVGTIALYLVGGNKMRPCYLAYMMVYIIFGASPAWLLSGVRYFAALFPVYMLLAVFAKNHKIAGGVLLGLSVAAMFAMAVAFVSGMSVM